MTYYIISAVLVLGVLIGISMMSKVKTANAGNTLSAVCTVIAIAVVLYTNDIVTAWQAWLGLAIGGVIGLIGAAKVKMIQMPQAVALLNGLGGLASALVAILTIAQAEGDMFAIYVGAITLLVGWVTFTGSLVAAGKLHKVLPQKPVVWKAHSAIVAITLIATVLAIVFVPDCMWLISVLSAFFGVAFAIRVGGADMPITISLLNSLSGVAGGIAGIAVRDPLLVAIGGIVGASGLLLTQIMCRAMNRSLVSILLGTAKKPAAAKAKVEEAAPAAEAAAEAKAEVSVSDILTGAKKVMIVPGYGMALAQAQNTVKSLADKLEAQGTEVKFAIHPVAGRMPGHMNVLLCEVDVPYDKLYEMDEINGEFADCDAAIIIGANDVVNPAANTAEGTPIYGMPVLNAADAKYAIVCNFDTKPGYAGVPNPLYESDSTIMLLGDAKETVSELISSIGAKKTEAAPVAEEASDEVNVADILTGAKKVMIVPGYGMALAQAQGTVKALADKLEAQGTEVKFAIHPVAGRMPGHMNVLLCEVDVPYDKLYEMDEVNGEFADCDAAIIIGANDVVNPAANTAEGTPIYGMPVLNAADAKYAIVCNFDTKPGYAGVPNPLYESASTIMMLGDAKETVANLTAAVGAGKKEAAAAPAEAKGADVATIIKDAKNVIIVPGYGMALAQAQGTVKALADRLESKGASVKFAIHPVAGRMPGHMNVLLCEVDVPYDNLYEMDDINGEFAACDLAIIVGAHDVVNPAANTAEGTPIYGMPVLNVADAKNVIVCNFDTKPGYAGVPNPLYESASTIMMLGDAKETVAGLMDLV